MATDEQTQGAPIRVLGTPLQPTTYEAWAVRCAALAQGQGTVAVDFTNTHVVTLRRHDSHFQEVTACFDHFIPDGMPLVWLLNLRGAQLRYRVYGPSFMRHCLARSPDTLSHYFLGGSQDCLDRLLATLRKANPKLHVAGMHHGYFTQAEEAAIVDEINTLAPDFVWVGLGTPKQQEWIQRNKSKLKRGVVLAVGFAFDVNAGTKADAPAWMQRAGLTWLFRMLSEPRRLLVRYLKYNSLFLWYLLWDGLHGRALARDVAQTVPARV